MDADVVVIGAGLAGFCAALEAAHHGASVVLLEKQPQVGGSTVLSGGSMAFAGTDVQASQGIADTDEALARDLFAVGDHANDPALVDVYVRNQLDSYRWLVSRGVRFHPVQAVAGQSVPRQHPTDPAEMICILHAEALATPAIRIVTDAPASRLVRDADGGRVVDVVLADGGTLRARKGVVLTAGSFSRNPEMSEQFAPGQAAAKRVGGPGNVGDGIKMAWQPGQSSEVTRAGFLRGLKGNS